MAHMIRQDRNIKGYKIKGLDITISQYADDTSLFLDGSERSLKHCLNALQEFARYSGLNINQGKTKAIWFGCPRPPEETMLPEFNLEWDPQNFSILGVTFTTDLNNITDRNINKHMNKIRTEIESWKKRNLTPFGKVTLIKAIFISRIVHILTALPNPSEETVLTLQLIFNNFLWNEKQNKIRKDVAYRPLDKGGLGMLDVKKFIQALKTTSIRRIKNSKSLWKELLHKACKKIDTIYKIGPSIKTITNNCNCFWKDVFDSYFYFSSKVHPTTLHEFENTSFVLNENIKIAKKCIDNNTFVQNNITKISQLKENGIFMNYARFKRINSQVNVDFLSFIGIIRAVKQYRQTLTLKSTRINRHMQPHHFIILSTRKGASSIYKALITENNAIKGIETWKKRLNIDIREDEVFFKLKKTTIDTKLRWTQYRVLHNILTTNKMVAKYNLDQKENCTFCDRYPESIEHLFWNCELIKNFWNNLNLLLNTKCKHIHNFKFNKVLIIMGCDSQTKTDT